ncbi:YolD-like family protein [Tumebacillus lipolyticus]|uniref:YolD-like family protein n=1 Tax=Tumebacillus lipolyticus TaxID=1280370 RepID=A0ABW5A4D9_9BACL
MRIADGNIFEAMRLVLPEHREAMKRAAVEAKKRSKPTLDEDAWQEIQYTLQEAMERQLPVAVTLFRPLEDEVLIGAPMMRSGSLWLHTEDGALPIDMRRVLKIAFAD